MWMVRNQQQVHISTKKFLISIKTVPNYKLSTNTSCISNHFTVFVYFRCMNRMVNESESCIADVEWDENGKAKKEWHYLTLTPSTCANCSNYISCESCVSTKICEWWTEEARCTRIGRLSNAVVNLQQCPIPCQQRSNCTQCLDERGRCVWCEATEECFSFAVYTSEYQFGLCREWTDQTSLNGVTSRTDSYLSINDQCKTCSRHTYCSNCLLTLSC